MAQRMQNPISPLNYLDYLRNSSDGFLTTDKYNYNVEFFNRRLWSGTIMPLSASCYQLQCSYTLIRSPERWAEYEVRIKSKYKLTGLGEAVFKLCKDSDFERSRLDGSLALWILRKNERRRQILRVKQLAQQPEMQALRRTYQDYKDSSIAIYEEFYHTINSYIKEILKGRNAEKVFYDSISTYINQQDKKHASLVPNLGLRYDSIFDNNLSSLAKEQLKLNELIMDNIYGQSRVNPFNILSALRNRPAEIMRTTTFKGEALDVTETSANLRNDRTREANGQPPESHEWMWIYLIKHHMSFWLIREFKKLYNIEFETPVESSLRFYVDIVNGKDGLYLFGDNGMYKQGNTVHIYDLSISDVLQGLIRRDSNGNNLCFFLRLDPDYDCGSTGGSLTPYWNLEGQLVAWRWVKDGNSSYKYPYIPGFIEESSTFLGHWWHKDGKISSKGLRCTKDAAKRASPIVVRPGKTSLMNWPRREEIKRNELIQSVIAAGVTKIDLKYFYNWAFKKGILANDIYVEYHNVGDQLEEILKEPEHVEEFTNLLGIDELSRLARPLVIA